MSTASKVAAMKERCPDLYCPAPRCLRRTGGGWCPRHKPAEAERSKFATAPTMTTSRNRSTLLGSSPVRSFARVGSLQK